MSRSKKPKKQKEKKTHSPYVGGMEIRLAMTATVNYLSARAEIIRSTGTPGKTVDWELGC